MDEARKSGEFARIERIFAPLAAHHSGALGLADDAALIRCGPGREIVATTDTLVAGVHFLGDESPEAIAAKLLRVNLSDLAAMGARPVAYLLAMALPSEISDAWLKRFADGLRADQEQFGLGLIGGDSVATAGPITLTVCALGEVEAGRALRRSGARPGDIVFVSGTIGDGALGLRAAMGELGDLAACQREALVRRYRIPEPRVDLGQRLVGLASAAVDVSDGLVADLGHIAATSGVGAEVEASRVPLSPAAAAVLDRRPKLIETVLTGGDDYELVFTAAEDRADAVIALAGALGLPVTAIGRIVRRRGVRVLDVSGRAMRLRHTGWRHG